jgi:hypothetical protein
MSDQAPRVRKLQKARSKALLASATGTTPAATMGPVRAVTGTRRALRSRKQVSCGATTRPERASQ